MIEQAKQVKVTSENVYLLFDLAIIVMGTEDTKSTEE